MIWIILGIKDIKVSENNYKQMSDEIKFIFRIFFKMMKLWYHFKLWDFEMLTLHVICVEKCGKFSDFCDDYFKM